MHRRRRRGRYSLFGLAIVIAVVALQQWRTHDRSGGDGAAATSTRSISLSHVGPFPVLRVVDGDTLDIETKSDSLRPKERIRLLRINTPERDEPGYERSTAALKALVEGREVHLEFEQPGVSEPDDYGRLLAYVILDGVDVNLEMVRRGWSRFFTKYGEGRFAEAYRKAEEEARAADAGLWSADGWNMLGREEPKPKRRD